MNSEKRENLRETISSLLYLETAEDTTVTEVRVHLSDSERPAIEFLVENNQHLSQNLATISKIEVIKIALDFFLPYSKYLLFMIRDSKVNAYADHKFVSASMMFGIWSQVQSHCDYDRFMRIKHYEARFQSNKVNFQNLCK